MLGGGIGRLKAPVGGRYANRAEVRHGPCQRDAGQVGVPAERQICPERTTYETDATRLDRRTLQHAHG